MKLVVVTKTTVDGEEVPDVREYDINDTLQNVSLGNLDILQKSTKTGDYPGTTRKSIKQTFTRLGDQEISRVAAWEAANPEDAAALRAWVAEEEARKAAWSSEHENGQGFEERGYSGPQCEPTDGDDLLADPDFRASMIGLIFLARRAVGENATVQQAADTPISGFFLKPDADELEEEADPKDVPAVLPDAG